LGDKSNAFTTQLKNFRTTTKYYLFISHIALAI